MFCRIYNYFNFLRKEVAMTRIITEEISAKLDAAIKAGVLNAETVDALKAEDAALEAKNLEQDATLAQTQSDLADAKADLQAIADAIKNPELPPLETADAVAAVLTESAATPGTVEPAFPTE